MRKARCQAGLEELLGALQTYHRSVPNAKKKRKPFPLAACIFSRDNLPHTPPSGVAAMIYTEPLFLGVTPTGARNYVADKVVSLAKPFFNACAGRFSVVEVAIKAGLPPENIYASDLGLFSSIIGFLADPAKKMDDLGIRILDAVLEPKGITDELDFAAHVMLILKLNQMKQTNLRGFYLREELLSSWSRCRQTMREQLETLVQNIAGIHHEIADIWDVVPRVSQEDVTFYASVPH